MNTAALERIIGVEPGSFGRLREDLVSDGMTGGQIFLL
jgi:hypothetical protein